MALWYAKRCLKFFLMAQRATASLSQDKMFSCFSGRERYSVSARNVFDLYFIERVFGEID